MIEPLPDAVQQRLDAHLDAVDEVLRRYQQNRSQRNAITDELNDQILDMISKRTGNSESTLADLEAVLVELDPPEAFARHSIDIAVPNDPVFPDEPRPRLRVNPWALTGLGWLIWCGVTFLYVLVGSLVGNAIGEPPISTDELESWHIPYMLIMLGGLLAPITTTAFGLLAMGQIRREPQRYSGWELAVFDALFFPIVVASIVLSQGITAMIYFGLQTIKLWSGKTNIFEDGMRPSTSAEFFLCELIGITLGLALTVWLTVKVVRRLNRPPVKAVQS